MIDLYTTQVHLKRLLAGQATAAFTPAPGEVLKVLDPAFFPGMGVLNEDDKGRLQCPVRDCGEWHRMLAAHLNVRHRAIGGAHGVKRALDIPKGTPLISQQTRANHSVAYKSRPRWGHGRPVTSYAGRGVANGGAHRRATMAERNWADTCPAQLQERIRVLARKLGHSPSNVEFKAEYGPGPEKSIRRLFGTWNNAKAVCRLSTYQPGEQRQHGLRKSTEDVMSALAQWVAIHGDLPSTDDTQNPMRAPRVPNFRTVLHALGVDSWHAAMRSAVDYLGIRSERYGAPTRKAS